MKVKTLGRKVNLKQSFTDMVDKRMQKLDRFFGDDADGQVTITLEKDRMTAEVTVKSRGMIYRSERTSNDMEQAFSDAADLIVKQIVKNKDKLGTRIKRAAVDAEMLDSGIADEHAAYNVVREKRFAVNPLSIEEAVLQMNMLGHSFFVYSDVDTGELCVVYKRRDDSYGVLIPER
ncbi:MAG: ribosome-associated translation inhibitor RaiA [Oscillospiraceae bacterium]